MRQPSNIEPRQGISIKEVIVVADNIFFRTADGDLYQMWVGFDNLPSIQLVERGIGDSLQGPEPDRDDWRRFRLIEEENARLRAALKPFSDMAEELFARNWNASQIVTALDNPHDPHHVTAGDYFAARATLKPL